MSKHIKLEKSLFHRNNKPIMLVIEKLTIPIY